MNRNYFLAGIFFLALASCTKKVNEDVQSQTDAAATSSRAVQASESGSSQPFVPNEILVKFKAGTSDESKNKAFSKIGGSVAERILTKAMNRFGDNEGVYLVHASINALEAISAVKGVEIEYAEPNYIYNHHATSNDNYYTGGQLWGMYGDGTTPVNQYGSQAGEAWAGGHTGSSSVVIGIIDEGAMFTHVDLAANFWTNPSDNTVNGVDEDGNGYVDDIHGWDFANKDNTIFDGTIDDHGTHVAGTIGAVGGNGIGVAGVNWAVKMISAKFLGRNGGTTANAIKAVDYITDLKTRHNLNIPATNNSWGGGGFSQSLKSAIDRAGAANILFVAAAGNSGANIETSLSYPSGYTSENIIAVASITSSGGLSSFSNYAATKVDIGAPGSGIYSTLPGKSGSNVVSSYGSYSGTSMATPHVTGGVALYASTHPGANVATIKAAILSSAVPTASLAGKCVTGGRLNVSGF